MRGTWIGAATLAGAGGLVLALPAAAEESCVECHEKVTPGIVKDFSRSAMSDADLTCDTCHGSDHKSANDVDKVKLPTPETCKTCHEDRYEQYANHQSYDDRVDLFNPRWRGLQWSRSRCWSGRKKFPIVRGTTGLAGEYSDNRPTSVAAHDHDAGIGINPFTLGRGL